MMAEPGGAVFEVEEQDPSNIHAPAAVKLAIFREIESTRIDGFTMKGDGF